MQVFRADTVFFLENVHYEIAISSFSILLYTTHNVTDIGIFYPIYLILFYVITQSLVGNNLTDHNNSQVVLILIQVSETLLMIVLPSTHKYLESLTAM